jgi:chromosome segregation ATPase
MMEDRTELTALKSELSVTLEQLRKLRLTIKKSASREVALSNALTAQTERANALQADKKALLAQSQKTEQRLSQENRKLKAVIDILKLQLHSERQSKIQMALQSDIEKERNQRDRVRTKEAHDKEMTKKEAAYSALQAANTAVAGTSRNLKTELDAERSKYQALDQLQARQKNTINNLTTQNKTLQQLRIDKQYTINCLTKDLASERRTIKELRRELEERRRRETGLSAKQLELQKIVGVPVTVRRVNCGGESSQEDLNKLTTLMQNHLRTAVEQFRRYRQVISIEYIMNDRLYWQYDDAKSKFSSHARPTTECILFHGTNGQNIDS